MGDMSRGLLLWPALVIKETPRRVGRLLAAVRALGYVQTRGYIVYWMQLLLWYLFDLFGGPELIQPLLRGATNVRSLTAAEKDAAKAVFGSNTIRLNEVRVASGGLLSHAFERNNNRAFVTWHTINLPDSKQGDLALLVHELTHVLQYEKVGSIYIFQGLWAQHKLGRRAYDYGGAEGLHIQHTAGKRLKDYNREQQGQIAQDYFKLVSLDAEVEGYEPFIRDLQRGII